MGCESFSSCGPLFFPCLELSGSKVQHLSWGCCVVFGSYAQGWGQVEGVRVGWGGVCSHRNADRAGRSLHLLHCCLWQRLLSPFPQPLQPGDPSPHSCPRLLPPALSQHLPLSASLSLALRRKVDVRCVHTLWEGWVGHFAGGGGAAMHVAVSLPVVSGSLGCPLPALQLMSSPPQPSQFNWVLTLLPPG